MAYGAACGIPTPYNAVVTALIRFREKRCLPESSPQVGLANWP
ncbi:hypothetical protein [Thermodesulfitimonas autotrophica]